MHSDLSKQLLALGYATGKDGRIFRSADKCELYEIKLGSRGVRDLRDSALHLATLLAGEPKIRQGYLLASVIRISAARVNEEWEGIKKVMLPAIAARMNLVAVADGTEVKSAALRETPAVEQFLQFAKETSRATGSQAAMAGNSHSMNWKHLEVEKVLLHRWLLKEGPIAIGTLGRQVGCSYPTTMQAIGRLTKNGMIERGRGRSVSLAGYSREQWAELLRRERNVYPPEEFVDPTAEMGAVEWIQRHLDRLNPQGAAMGGVVAARKWDSSFNLNGTPRIDIVLHTPISGSPHGHGWIHTATEFVRHIDPALKRRASQVRGATVLVMHPLYRRESLFLREEPSKLPWADPVDVIYHLNLLGLTVQAGELLHHLRQDAKS